MRLLDYLLYSLNIGPPSEMPHPEHDWDAFFSLIRAGNAKELKCWDPLSKKPQVKKTYRKQKSCVVPLISTLNFSPSFAMCHASLALDSRRKTALQLQNWLLYNVGCSHKDAFIF